MAVFPGLSLSLQAKKYPGDQVAQGAAELAVAGTAAGTPEQDNNVDCGVFTCYFSNYLSADKALAFGAVDMPLFRRRLALDILNKAVL